jgi:hypothetical protein
LSQTIRTFQKFVGMFTPQRIGHWIIFALEVNINFCSKYPLRESCRNTVDKWLLMQCRRKLHRINDIFLTGNHSQFGLKELCSGFHHRENTKVTLISNLQLVGKISAWFGTLLFWIEQSVEIRSELRLIRICTTGLWGVITFDADRLWGNLAASSIQ